MKKNDNRKVPIRRANRQGARVETTTQIRLDSELKDRFVKALSVGRPTTITDALEGLMIAYCEAVERDGKQPEFPLDVRSKSDQK